MATRISRLEQGDYNDTVGMLERIAQALDAELMIQLVPGPLGKAACQNE